MRPISTAWRQLALQRRCFSSTPRRLDNYAFIGLGQMGFQMAKNLQIKLPTTDNISLFDIDSEVVERLVEEMESVSTEGASVVCSTSAADASRDADIVITALPEPSHVKSVYASILKANFTPRSDARVFIDCSTIDPSSSQKVAASVTKAFPNGTAHFVDAPMSGGIIGAAAGTLTFMLGAPEALVPRLESVLLRMGKAVFHCGAQGTGLSAKLANNYLLAVNNIATAEAMNLGMRWGLDPKVLAGVINVSTGRCWPSEVNNPVKGVIEKAPANRDYADGFGISLMRKDLNLAIAAAQKVGARLELAGSAKTLYEAAEKDGKCENRDFSVVYRYIGGKE